jgi:hypothetical protein
MVTKLLLDKILRRFFVNYSSEKLNLSIFKGIVELKDLIINTMEVDKLFDEMNQPFVLKFGLMKRVKIDVSILKGCLEEVTISDLILVVGPDASKADRNFDLSPQQKTEVLYQMIKNYRKYNEWKLKPSSKKNGGMTRCKSIPSAIWNEMLLAEREQVKAFMDEDFSYTSIEERINWLVTTWAEQNANLEAPIKIENLRVYYEDTEVLGVGSGHSQHHITCCLVFHRLSFLKVSLTH